jgi:hypothetical protein
MPQQNKNAPPSGKQAIHCNVQSCRHHGSGDYCALSAISVAACQDGSTGNPADESMCASYEVQ